MGDGQAADPLTRFVPTSQEDLAPSGAKARFAANVAAIELSRSLASEGRPATAAERAVLARYGSWGAVPQVFDSTNEAWASEHEQLKALLDETAYAAAQRTTINAHFTDPAYARRLWETLQRLGFDGGRVLEPGAGAGTFIGLAPSSAEMIGVELDPTTAAIAQGLYPHATIRTESFADTTLPAGYFDAAIGNVPFGEIKLNDPVHNPDRSLSMHNHFLVKSLALTRPGGLVGMLTSSFTLDARDPSARETMNELADLVGAVRLPSGAHRRAAGTEVVTDLLIFRRREPASPPRSDAWVNVTPRRVDGKTIHINAYYDTHPDHILGEISVGTGMYGNETVHVRADLEALPDQLTTALDSIVTEATERQLTMSAPDASTVQARVELHPADLTTWDGSIVRTDEGFAEVVGGRRHPLRVAKKNIAELEKLLELRDGIVGLLELESRSFADSEDLTKARAELKGRYDAYVNRYGPINRYTLSKNEARLTPEAPRLLKRDPFGVSVLALELFDDETQTAHPAAILTRRVVMPRTVKENADTPSEALALSMDRHGEIRLDTIAYLLGTDTEEARSLLGELVYDDPAQGGQLVSAAEYLSGNVREKLDQARAAAESDPDRYSPNVPALEAVIPETIGSDQIEARIGSVWIDAETHEQFFRDVLRDQSFTVASILPGQWEVHGNKHTVLARDEYGTSEKPAPAIAKALLEQRPIEVTKEIESGEGTRRIVDVQETTAAQEKADKLQERFAEWVWENPEREARLVTEYNRRFNNLVLRDYASAGNELTFPGLLDGWEPRSHQRAAVARIIAEPAVGLFHQVGAGKTAEMVMGAMELRRMGLVNKPAIVVPNHMLEQFSREWVTLYPQARILAASSEDLTKDRRRLFVAKVAANDWDGVVMTRTAFQSLSLGADFEQEYIAGEVETMREALEAARVAGLDRTSIKGIEKKILAMEERHKALIEMPRDPGLTFEATGIDNLFIDEAHNYKNLTVASNIPGAGKADGSKLATDLHMKLEYLRSKGGSHIATLATATPIANSVTEAYVMQRYLRPDLLEAAGIRVFDQWAATFGQTQTEIEMGPTGGTNFRMKTRFSKFQNVPEMLKMWSVFADVKTADDLNLPVPLLAEREDGHRLPLTHVIPPGPLMEDYLAQIAERAEAIAGRLVDPSEDNMLNVSTDGRKAALDVRLVGLEAEPVESKLDVVAATILKEWEQNRDTEYVVKETGEPSPILGGLQLVFCDMGTPKSDGTFSAYSELKQLLVDGGMPEGAIRFVHEARNDAEKGRLFAAARAGQISVLIGSTEKMGVGTNIQDRAIALHHIDAPWKPAEVEQRDGRVIRQHNQNREVRIHRYVVERSFDSYMWQTLERKARFIAQIMRGKLDQREIDDVGDQTLSAAETKAIASGNPLILEQAQVNDELARLERLERAHRRSQSNLRQTYAMATSRVEVLTENIATLTSAIPTMIDTSGESFRMKVGSSSYDSRADAGAALGQWARQANVAYSWRSSELGEVGSIGPFTIQARLIASAGQADVEFALQGIRDVAIRVPRERAIAAGVGLVQRLENLQASLPRVQQDTQSRLAEAQQTLVDAQRRIGAEFPHTEALEERRARAAEIRAILDDLATPTASEGEQDTSTNEVVDVSDPAALRQLIIGDTWWEGKTTKDISAFLEAVRAEAANGSEPHRELFALTTAHLKARFPSGTDTEVARPIADTGPVAGHHGNVETGWVVGR